MRREGFATDKTTFDMTFGCVNSGIANAPIEHFASKLPPTDEVRSVNHPRRMDTSQKMVVVFNILLVLAACPCTGLAA